MFNGVYVMEFNKTFNCLVSHPLSKSHIPTHRYMSFKLTPYETIVVYSHTPHGAFLENTSFFL